MKTSVLSLLALTTAVSAWLPHERNLFGEQPNSVSTRISAGKGRSVKRFDSGYNKIRGVNLGSLFIIEPWMASQEWATMGCGSAKSEFDCVIQLGQEAADTAFQKHWDTWITESDLDAMKSYGLNTIRVPVGYWIVENIVDRDSEHFPQGGMQYLDRLAGWAADRDIYMILDLHGAPYAQDAQQPFTGQYAPSAGFFVSSQYDRAYQFLQNVTERIHKNNAYRTTGMLEVLNEPEQNPNHPDLVTEYYVTAYSKIRDTESTLGITSDKQLTIQFMDQGWGAGDPADAVGGKSGIAYDDHRYLKWAPIEVSKSSYIATSCADGSTYASDSATTPTIVGEWSLAVADSVEQDADWDPSDAGNQIWYKQWWATQVQAYEKGAGWVFWSWKTELGDDWRWSYQQAVEVAKVIPEDPNTAASFAQC